jgi:hypothetical protein
LTHCSPSHTYCQHSQPLPHPYFHPLHGTKQHFLNTFTITSGDTYMLSWSWATGIMVCFIILMVSEHGLQTRVIQSTVVSNYPYKAYSLKCLFMELSLQEMNMSSVSIA